MMRKTVFLDLAAVLGFASCTKEGAWGDGYKSDMGEYSASDGAMGPGGYGQGRPGGQAGVLTAGEWNDLAN